MWLKRNSAFFFRCGRVWGKPSLPARLPEHHRRLQVQLPPGLSPALPVEPVCRQVVFPCSQDELLSAPESEYCFLSENFKLITAATNTHFKLSIPGWNQREVITFAKWQTKKKNNDKGYFEGIQNEMLTEFLNSSYLLAHLLHCSSSAHTGVLFRPTKSSVWLKTIHQPKATLSSFWSDDAEVVHWMLYTFGGRVQVFFRIAKLFRKLRESQTLSLNWNCHFLVPQCHRKITFNGHQRIPTLQV